MLIKPKWRKKKRGGNREKKQHIYHYSFLQSKYCHKEQNNLVELIVWSGEIELANDLLISII